MIVNYIFHLSEKMIHWRHEMIVFILTMIEMVGILLGHYIHHAVLDTMRLAVNGDEQMALLQKKMKKEEQSRICRLKKAKIGKKWWNNVSQAAKSVSEESVESEFCLEIELEQTFRMIYLLYV